MYPASAISLQATFLLVAPPSHANSVLGVVMPPYSPIYPDFTFFIVTPPWLFPEPHYRPPRARDSINSCMLFLIWCFCLLGYVSSESFILSTGQRLSAIQSSPPNDHLEEIDHLIAHRLDSPNPSLHREPITLPSDPALFSNLDALEPRSTFDTKQLLQIGTDKVNCILLVEHLGVVGVCPSSVVSRVAGLPFLFNTQSDLDALRSQERRQGVVRKWGTREDSV
jgi:hypothetical protein